MTSIMLHYSNRPFIERLNFNQVSNNKATHNKFMCVKVHVNIQKSFKIE